MKKTVQDFYDQDADREWQRLSTTWLEFAITRYFVDRLVTAPSSILDIGGGPGRYALDLAKAGHCVELADLSPANIAFAEDMAARQGLKLEGTAVADARDLSRWPDNHFDAVLNLGPLYNLTRSADRQRAIQESIRVLKIGGYGFFAFLSRNAPLYFNLKSDAGDIIKVQSIIDQITATGTYKPQPGEGFFTEAIFDDPASVLPLMESFDLKPVHFFGAESCMAQSETRLKGLSEEKRKMWLDLAIERAESPAAIHGSEHLVFVGRKAG